MLGALSKTQAFMKVVPLCHIIHQYLFALCYAGAVARKPAPHRVQQGHAAPAARRAQEPLPALTPWPQTGQQKQRCEFGAGVVMLTLLRACNSTCNISVCVTQGLAQHASSALISGQLVFPKINSLTYAST